MPEDAIESQSIEDVPSKLYRWRKMLKSVDWLFIRGSSLTSVGLLVGRIIGFAFSFLLARTFSTEDFGVVQYIITLANILTITTVPFTQEVMPWFISRHKSDSDELNLWFGNGWLILIILLGLTIAITIPILAITNRLSISVIIIYLGLTLFYGYEGLARGFLTANKLLAAYIGSNIIQLIVIILVIFVLGTQSTTPLLIIYGLSYFLPIAALQRYSPFPIRFDIPTIHWDIIKDMIRFAIPVWISNALYRVSSVMDILYLEHFWGDSSVGIYALTKTIIMAFTFFPQGVTMILMPKVAESSTGNYRSILVSSVLINLLISFLILIGYILFYEPVIVFIGESYFAGMQFAVVMALSAIIYTLHSIVTSYLTGRKRPHWVSASRLVDTIVTISVGLILIPQLGVLGAAYTSLCSAVTATASYPIMGLLYTLFNNRTSK